MQRVRETVVGHYYFFPIVRRTAAHSRGTLLSG